MNNPGFRQEIYAADEPQAIYDLIAKQAV